MLWSAPRAGQSYRQTPVGELEGEHPSTLSQVSPSDFKSSAQNPAVETSQEYSDLSLGFGQKTQIGKEDRRYRFASAADCSIQGQIVLGPYINTLTPATTDSTNGIIKFFEIDGSLYALTGRYVLVRAEVQTITEGGTPTGGTFTISYGGNTTAGIPYNETAANVQIALRALHADLASVTVTRTGASNFVWTVVMRGAGENPAQMTNADSLTGGSGDGGTITSATLYTIDQAGAWQVDKDLGSSIALDVIVFYTNAGSGANYAYIACGDSNFFYRFDGTTYTQHGSLYATSWCMQGRDLWRSTGNTAAKVDVDAEPWTAGNWSATNAFTIGEKGSTITKLVLNAAGVLVIMKSDGIYTLDEVGEDHQLYPGMRFSSTNTENGKYPYISENWVYATYGGTHYRMDQSMTIEPIGPEQYADNNSPVSGYVTAGIGTQFVNYAGIYNPDTGHSHLLKFGAWVSDGQGGSKRIDAWHGSLSPVNTGYSGLTSELSNPFASDKITAMWRSTMGAPSNHERLYIGTLAGKIHWIILPCKANPVTCSNYEYTWSGYDISLAQQDDAVGAVFLPYFHGGYPTDQKIIRQAACTGVFVNGTGSEQVSGLGVGSLASTPAYTFYPTSNSPLLTASPGATTPVGAAVTLGDMVLALTQYGSGADRKGTPVVQSLGITYVVHPIIRRLYNFSVLAENGLRRGDGVPIRIGADQIRSLIKTACSTASVITVILASEDILTMVLSQYKEDIVWDEDLKQSRFVVSFQGVETDAALAAVW